MSKSIFRSMLKVNRIAENTFIKVEGEIRLVPGLGKSPTASGYGESVVLGGID